MEAIEGYFHGLGGDVISLAQSRVPIDDVLAQHFQGRDARAIHARIPALRLDEIYATLTFYYTNQAEIDAYLARRQGRRAA